MSPPTLYSIDLSPPVRSVRITAKLIGLELNLRNVDLLGGEHLQDWYLALNPQHTLPTLDDNGKVIWESTAICGYLVDEYGTDDKLYPKDNYLRAKVNQNLFFAGDFFMRLRACLYPIIRLGAFACQIGSVEAAEEKIDALRESYELLEKFLATSPFLVGDHLTIADINVIPTLEFAQHFAPLDEAKYPKLSAWINRLKKADWYNEFIAPYGSLFKQLLEKKKAENRAKQQQQ